MATAQAKGPVKAEASHAKNPLIAHLVQAVGNAGLGTLPLLTFCLAAPLAAVELDRWDFSVGLDLRVNENDQIVSDLVDQAEQADNATTTEEVNSPLMLGLHGGLAYRFTPYLALDLDVNVAGKGVMGDMEGHIFTSSLTPMAQFTINPDHKFRVSLWAGPALNWNDVSITYSRQFTAGPDLTAESTDALSFGFQVAAGFQIRVFQLRVGYAYDPVEVEYSHDDSRKTYDLGGVFLHAGVRF